MALIWGGEDLISLAKEVARIHKDADFEQFQARGGVMDGEPLTAERVLEISRWPSRSEQLSILSGSDPVCGRETVVPVDWSGSRTGKPDQTEVGGG